MKSTGLFEGITTIYGENTVKNILNGSDYDQMAIRCHCIITSALKQILLEQLPRGIADAASLFYEECYTNTFSPSTLEGSPEIKALMGKLAKLRKKTQCLCGKPAMVYVS